MQTQLMQTASLAFNIQLRFPMTDSKNNQMVEPDRLSGISVLELMTRNLTTVSPHTPIRTAAQLMYQHRISCLPVVEGKSLVGLVTEADFVGRIVAADRSGTNPVGQVMTSRPFRVNPQHSVLDVLTLMTRHRISHMPVCASDGNELLGIVTQTDVIRHQITSSVFMVGDIARAPSCAAISTVVADLPRLLVSLLANGNSAYGTGRIISSITGAVTRRLLELAEEKLGDAPIPYVWLACGSQGRQEQTGSTDQDNCLILDDSYKPSTHSEYFKQLACIVCDGLNECGYVYCPGNMMASNSQWRQPLSTWQEYFTQWITQPGKEAQLLASVMFDLRPIAGESSLYEPLRDLSLSMTKSNSIFVAHMSTSCLTHQPPLGWFGKIKTHKEGVARGKIDLKHDAIVPIVELARLHALSAGLTPVNTIERLQTDSNSGIISPSGRVNLADAYESICLLRLTKQASQIKRSKPPDNLIDPTMLTSIQRDRLRHSLQAIKDIQAALSNRVAAVGR